MSRTQNNESWSRAQGYLHWGIAVALVLMMILGYSTNASAGQPHQGWLRLSHQILGCAVLVLALLRLWWRWRRPRPAWPEPLPGWQRTLAHAMHGLLYTLPILLPLLGVALSWADPYLGLNLTGASPTSLAAMDSAAVQQWAMQLREINQSFSDQQAAWIERLHLAHYFAAWLLCLVIVVHVAGAYWHFRGPAGLRWRQLIFRAA